MSAKNYNHSKPTEGAAVPDSQKKLDLGEVPVRVARIHIEGIARTKDDFVSKLVKEVFSAGNFQELVFKAFEVKTSLEKLGAFKKVGIFIDTSSVGPNDYEVTFNVDEARRVLGNVSTLIGNNQGSLLVGLKFPNAFGRAEKVQLEYTHGTKNTSGQYLAFSKPFGLDLNSAFSTGLYQSHGEFPWSSYSEKSRGLFLELSVPSRIGDHSLRWEGAWRELQCLSRTTSFSVREQAGHSLKSALKHVLRIDTRDDSVLPSRGTLFKLTQELAGLGGDAHFHKHDVEFQLSRRLWLDTVVQMSLACGVVAPFTWRGRRDAVRPALHISDKFFLGGPLNLRGFTIKGVGPQNEGNFLGANSYWHCGLHMYTPLPFRPGKGGFGDLFRTHFFVNLGNIVNLDMPRPSWESAAELFQTARVAYGAGIVLRIGGIARLELNYCFPYRYQSTDSVNPGFQFGIGLSFL